MESSLVRVNTKSELRMPDLVVAGAGMAGLAAAARARELGADVTVLEKGDRAGGSMLLSSGVIWRHAFKNIRVQLVTVVALSYGGMLEGAVLIETVFGWPGFGQYLTNALVIGDMNVVVACTLIIGCVFIALNVISDLLYKFFDPRIQ